MHDIFLPLDEAVRNVFSSMLFFSPTLYGKQIKALKQTQTATQSNLSGDFFIILKAALHLEH